MKDGCDRPDSSGFVRSAPACPADEDEQRQQEDERAAASVRVRGAAAALLFLLLLGLGIALGIGGGDRWDRILFARLGHRYLDQLDLERSAGGIGDFALMRVEAFL